MIHRLNEEQKSDIAADIEEIETRVNELKEVIKNSDTVIEVGAERFPNPLVRAEDVSGQIGGTAKMFQPKT